MFKPSLKVLTPSDLEIVMKRSFNSPRQRVWDAMTKPELIRRWMFCPPGWSWATCEMDLRVGGKYHWAWNGPDGRLALTIRGVHKEVILPSRLVHTESMRMGPGAGCEDGGDGSAEACDPSQDWELLATIELAEAAGLTNLTMTLLFPHKEGRDMALASNMDKGVAAGYLQLDAMLAEQAGIR